MTEAIPDAYGIVANVVQDSALRRNSRVWICWVPGDPETVFVRGISHRGRRIQKWLQTKHLTNFRTKWIPMHLRSMYRQQFPPSRFSSRAEAEEYINRRLTA